MLRSIEVALFAKRTGGNRVCDLSRHLWRINDAFLLAKRLLGLAYLRVADSNSDALRSGTRSWKRPKSH